MRQIKYVNGPYVNTHGRRNIHIVYTDGSSKHMSHARFVVEQAIGRELSGQETVDHMDEDPLNDAVSNLAIVTREDNAKASIMSEWYVFDCPVCHSRSRKKASVVRKNWKRSTRGPYCSRTCGAVGGHSGGLVAANGVFVKERFMERSWASIVETHQVPTDFSPTYERSAPEAREAVRT